MDRQRLHEWLAYCLVLGAIVVTGMIYAPGLHGGFLFDDFPNVVNNSALQSKTWHFADWIAAMLSSPASDMKRPISMLSFAVNASMTGLAAFPLKLTNLCIHLVNGALLFAIVQVLVREVRRRGNGFSVEVGEWAAALCAALWLVLPINLTSVLYVVQRMESLAQTFVLVGLLIYLEGRLRDLDGRRGGTALTWGALSVFTALGTLAKETGILLPLYAFIVEWVVFRFEAAPGQSTWRVRSLFLALLALPGALAVVFYAPRFFAPGAYGGRPFTLLQRLLSEGRVLVDYLYWIVVPNSKNLSFFHDEIPMSVSEFSPPSTAWSQLALLALFVAGLLLRRRRPLASVGILWFFACHSLTATIIPLELIFEHRNYFASAGIMLALADLLLLAPPQRLRAVGMGVLLFGVVANAAVTRERAYEWGDSLRFAQSESENHPNSARAWYEYGRVLLIRSNYSTTSPMTARAFPVLDHARQLKGASTLPEQALILLAVHTNRAVDPVWWSGMADKLRRNPITQEDISAVESLMHCQQNGDCPPDHVHLQQAFEAAMSHPGPSARLQSVYGDFAGSELGDDLLAEKLMRGAVDASGGDPVYQYNLLHVLVRRGEYDEARDLIRRINLMELTDDLRGDVLNMRQSLGVASSGTMSGHRH